MGYLISFFISDNDAEHTIHNKKELFTNTAWLREFFPFLKGFVFKSFHDEFRFCCRNRVMQIQVANECIAHGYLYGGLDCTKIEGPIDFTNW